MTAARPAAFRMAALAPPAGSDRPTNDEILDAFLSFLLEREIELYDHQEEAILELFSGANVILNTPTGSGKSLVALAVQYRAICLGLRCYYTVPVKALANEKFLSLCETFGADRVGMITGDATVNPSAPVICCTAEILSNQALREGSDCGIDDVVMDEFHYYSDPERGVAWQAPLLILSRTRFLLMSATIGDTDFFEEALTRRNGLPTTVVKSGDRPVPLEFEYSLESLEEKVEALVESNRAPIYLVHFTQLACARSAQNLMSRNFCSKEEKEAIAEILSEADFSSPWGKEMKKFLRHGLGIHHAGLLPKYRVLVEKLAQRGLLKVICGTDTLGVGVNVPIRTVLFTQLFKYGGQTTETLAVRDFQQISGRAGRRGFDTVGYVVAQAPEHVIANRKAEEKAKEKGKKKVVKKKPPEKGFVNWDENTFQRLIDSAPEKLTSQFRIDHGVLLNVLQRPGVDGCRELRDLIASSHDSPVQRKRSRKKAFSLFRGLVEGGILRIVPPGERSGPEKIVLNRRLPREFSLHQALALYLLHAIPRLDPEDPNYAVQVLSLVEAILENPSVILRRQVDKRKTELMAEMKAEGVEYDERMERLEQVEYPKPGKDFIYDTYNEFVVGNPWAREASVRPKSVAREMFEHRHSFDDYIRLYGLERSEAVLLRHLTEVYKVLVQTVPDGLKNDDLDEAEAFFEKIVRGVDSSLLDEWEKMRSGASVEPTIVELAESGEDGEKPPPISQDRESFVRAIHGRLFQFLRNFSLGEIEEAATRLEGLSDPESRGALRTLRREFVAEHERVRFDPEARNRKHLRIDERDRVWTAELHILDSREHDDWILIVEIDLDRSDATGQPAIRFRELGEGRA